MGESRHAVAERSGDAAFETVQPRNMRTTRKGLTADAQINTDSIGLIRVIRG
jgi:hypothetical protein